MAAYISSKSSKNIYGVLVIVETRLKSNLQTLAHSTMWPPSVCVCSRHPELLGPS